MKAQCSVNGATASIHRLSVLRCSAVICFLKSGGGMRRLAFS